jgi:DNA-binding transcriptional LysR family regulator
MQPLSRAYRYFAEVAREGSVRKAAVRLNVAASAVNHQILELEDSLGVALFERRPSGLKLSAAGELLIHRVRIWQMEFNQTRAAIDDLQRLRRGKIRLAAISGLVSDFVPRVIQRFSQAHPLITYEIEVGTADEIADMLDAGKADICLTFDVPPRRPFKRVASLVSRIGVAVAPNHMFAKRTALRLYDLIDTSVAIPSRSAALRDFIAVSESTGAFQLSMKVESNSIEIVKSLARLMQGVALLTDFEVAREVRSGELVHVPLEGNGVPVQLLVALIREGLPQPVAVAAFVEQLQIAFDAAASRKSP